VRGKERTRARRLATRRSAADESSRAQTTGLSYVGCDGRSCVSVCAIRTDVFARSVLCAGALKGEPRQRSSRGLRQYPTRACRARPRRGESERDRNREGTCVRKSASMADR